MASLSPHYQRSAGRMRRSPCGLSRSAFALAVVTGLDFCLHLALRSLTEFTVPLLSDAHWLPIDIRARCAGLQVSPCARSSAFRSGCIHPACFTRVGISGSAVISVTWTLKTGSEILTRTGVPHYLGVPAPGAERTGSVWSLKKSCV